MEPQPQEMEQRVAAFEAYTKNMGLIQHIIAQMKEVPILPSQLPGKRDDGSDDINPLIKVEFPEGGGVLTFMDNHEYPYKGFPIGDMVEKIDVMKKINRAVLSSLYHSLKGKSKFKLLFLLTVPWLFEDIAKAFLYTFYRLVDRVKIKPIRYCDALRELHRAFSIEYRDDTGRETRFMVRDLVCMVLEYDNAYRFRFQDIIVELDKENLKKNTAQEISRLLNLLSSRETTQEIKDTWKLVQYFLPLYLRINKNLRQAIIDTLSEVNLEKVALSVEDRHYSEKRKDYKFSFMK